LRKPGRFKELKLFMAENYDKKADTMDIVFNIQVSISTALLTSFIRRKLF